MSMRRSFEFRLRWWQEIDFSAVFKPALQSLLFSGVDKIRFPVVKHVKTFGGVIIKP